MTSASDAGGDQRAENARGDGGRWVLRVELELEMEHEPVRGWLRSGGHSEEFVGWLALADALGRLHDRSRMGGAAGASRRPARRGL